MNRQYNALDLPQAQSDHDMLRKYATKFAMQNDPQFQQVQAKAYQDILKETQKPADFTNIFDRAKEGFQGEMNPTSDAGPVQPQSKNDFVGGAMGAVKGIGEFLTSPWAKRLGSLAISGSAPGVSRALFNLADQEDAAYANREKENRDKAYNMALRGYELEASDRNKALDREQRQLQFSSNLEKNKNQSLDSAVIDLQKNGGRVATDEDFGKLPKQAFTTLGSGENKVTMVKPVKPLAAEAATKFAVARKAREGANELLADFDKNPSLGDSLRLSGTKGAKRLPGSQEAAIKLDLITEGLGRALSGAAVPESEIKNFRSLFAVNPLDTDEAIKFKLKRSIEIVNDLENLMKYGASDNEISSYVSKQKSELKNRGNESSINLKGKDKEAYDWAIKNPTDKRAIEIMKGFGISQ